MSQHSPAHNVIAQIKIKLLGVTKPPVWRRVQLRADTRLDQLHEILQAALGWENYHMHAFSFGEEEFGIPDPELGFSDERRATLGELIDLGARFPLHLRLRRQLGARDPRRRPARPRS
jgi:Plasmid pRiA4b ORF-3-like protein